MGGDSGCQPSTVRPVKATFATQGSARGVKPGLRQRNPIWAEEVGDAAIGRGCAPGIESAVAALEGGNRSGRRVEERRGEDRGVEERRKRGGAGEGRGWGGGRHGKMERTGKGGGGGEARKAMGEGRGVEERSGGGSRGYLDELFCVDGVGGDGLGGGGTDLEQELHAGEEDAVVAVREEIRGRGLPRRGEGVREAP